MLETVNIDGLGVIPTYNLLIGFGIIFGLIHFERKNKDIDDASKFNIFNVLFLSFLFGFIGSRIFDILFFSKVLSVNNLLNGSSTFMGGLLFALFISIISAKIFRLNYINTLNKLIPFIVISHFFGRIGCFLAGCCFGKETANTLIGVKFPSSSLPYTHYNQVLHIHPTQLYEAFCLALIFIVVEGKKNKIVPYFVMYGFFRFFIEFFRNDPRGDFFLFELLSPSQLMSIIFITMGALLYRYKIPKQNIT